MFFKAGCSQFGWYFIFIRFSVCPGGGGGGGGLNLLVCQCHYYILSLICFGMGTVLYTARAAFYDYTERKKKKKMHC